MIIGNYHLGFDIIWVTISFRESRDLPEDGHRHLPRDYVCSDPLLESVVKGPRPRKLNRNLDGSECSTQRLHRHCAIGLLSIWRVDHGKNARDSVFCRRFCHI